MVGILSFWDCHGLPIFGYVSLRRCRSRVLVKRKSSGYSRKVGDLLKIHNKKHVGEEP